MNSTTITTVEEEAMFADLVNGTLSDTNIEVLKIPNIVVRIAESCAAIMGNLLTIFAIGMYSNMRTSTNILIAHLACWDLMGAMSIFFQREIILDPTTSYYQYLCQLKPMWHIVYFMGNAHAILLLWTSSS